MTDKLKEIIKREVEKLPKERQEAIYSLDWVKITEEIGKKYLLNEEEITDLQTQTLLVLIGLRRIDYLAIGIENEIAVSRGDADKIADEVLKKVFAPIGNIIIENIKKSEKHKDANAEQNLNFILSGGDYSAFVAPVYGDISPPPSGEVGRGFSNSPHPDPLLKGEGDKPRKMDDLRSKFTI